jgi:hypothetical protein
MVDQVAFPKMLAQHTLSYLSAGFDDHEERRVRFALTLPTSFCLGSRLLQLGNLV